MNLKPDSYFNLYANCIPVRGYSRCVICDLQNLTADLITIGLYEILTEHREKTINEIIVLYGTEVQDTIVEYFDFLIKKKFIFFSLSNENHLFPFIDLQWHYPHQIQNAIIDIEFLKHRLDIITELAELGCLHLQLRLYSGFNNYKYLKELLSQLNLITLHSVQIICPYNSQWDMELNDFYFFNHSTINNIIFYKSNTNKLKEFLNNAVSVNYFTHEVLPTIHCGIIDTLYFTVNIPHFTESQHHNTCLNRKISIDVNGEIKNCPSMAKSYGNIRDTKLIDVVNNPEFQKVWHIKKDEITKCKDCEFRHICTDCRAYIENPDDQYSAPLKCGYNPYTCEWEEWSTNPLKQKPIEFYGMQELVKK